MKKALQIFLYAIAVISIAATSNVESKVWYTYKCNPIFIQMFNLDIDGKPYKNIGNLKSKLKEDKVNVLFAMNGGMFTSDLRPQGLYVEKEKVLNELDSTQRGYGNFYMQPNGVFYINKKGKGIICKSSDVKIEDARYATQSGPLLLIDGEVHPKFIEDSKNLNIRNGVGVLPDGNLLFAISKRKVNFHEMAMYFKERGCKWALYLDGFVSKAYIPDENLEQLDGELGVLIAVLEVEG
ncbi:hypothetical protein GYB22_04770 [bacterium]|nr:hypothetical protein [bacterium]